jgi:acyl transferase domain-containing protein
MLPVNYAFHSPQTAGFGAELTRALNGLSARPTSVPFISTVMGAAVDGAMLDGFYWGQNVTDMVRFSAATDALIAGGHRLFLEVAPDRALSSPIKETLAAHGCNGAVLASMRHGLPERATLLNALGALYAEGCSVEWSQVYRDKAPHVALPTYPWQHQRFWIEGDPLARGRDPEGATTGTDGIDSWLYELQWSAKAADGVVPDVEPGTWLILGDEHGVGEQLVPLLEQAGHRCVLVKRNAFAPSGNAQDVVGDVYHQLIKDHANQEVPLRGVVHLWALDTTPTDRVTASSLIEDQQLGARSAVEVIKALGANSIAGDPRIWLVTRGVHRVGERGSRVAISQAPLWAIGRTCAAEHPHLWGGLVDLDPEAAAQDAAAQLFEALRAADGEDQVAFDRGDRYVARLARMRSMPSPSLKIHADAAYLITGGLDGVGLEVARWLTAKGARHLVLVGRTVIPSRERWTASDQDEAVARRIAAIQSLEASGATVETPSVDVADESQMASLAESLRRTGRRLAGIFHAASVWRDADGRGLVAPLSATTAESFDIVLPPKVAGSWLLQQLCDPAALDFTVFFSSGAALVGSAGQGNYAAANAFMDSLAHDLAARGARALSINWGPIADIGFAATSEGRSVFELWRRRGIMAISPAQLGTALERLIAGGAVQAGVMKTDWELLRNAYAEMLDAPWASKLVTKSAPRHRVDLLKILQDTAPRDRHELLATQIQAQVVAVMGFSPAEAPEFDQGLFDLGMDSLLALDLKNRLQTALKRDIPVAALFEHSTITSLTDYVLREVLALPAGEPTAQTRADAVDLVSNIAEMSEAEVERLLAQKMTEGAA